MQEYNILYKSLNRWLNDSIKLMDLKSPLPNDYIEIKSLIADLKTFRLEEYGNKQFDKKKLTNIHNELQVIFVMVKKILNIIDTYNI